MDRQLQRSPHYWAERGSIVLKSVLPGFRGWMAQGITDVSLPFFCVFVLVHSNRLPSYGDWRGRIVGTLAFIATALERGKSKCISA